MTILANVLSRSLMTTLLVMTMLAVVLTSTTAFAQVIDPENRPVAQVRIEGLKQVPEKLVTNQLRLDKGQPYLAKVVQEDIVRLTHLGRFSAVSARVEAQNDGSVILTYVLTEQPLLSDVQTVGNKAISDQVLLALVLLRAGDPMDKFLIDKGIQEIKRAYETKGFFVTDVNVDQELLDESGILLFRVREGPKVRIRQIKFEGNDTFTDQELRSKIKSENYFFVLKKGELSRERLLDDAARLRTYYQDRGYLDAQVGRRIDLSPDQKNAVVVFFIEEGKQYTVSKMQVVGNTAISNQQIFTAMNLEPGGIFSADQLRRSERSVRNLYGQLGYIDADIRIDRLFHQDVPRVDVLVNITEGNPVTVGKVSIQGNDVTKDKVILRQIRGMNPGFRFDSTGIELTEQRLTESTIFSDAKISLLGESGDPVRDAVIEVKEENTGTLTFGAGVSSDAGIIGAIDVVQRNFDIADPPESFGEIFSGKAFRGAGQYFALSIQPGNETSRYSVAFREPYLLESKFFLDTEMFYFQREREKYNEQRVGGNIGLGQRFGDVWSANVGSRMEQVYVDSIEKDAPVDVFAEEGENTLTSLAFSVSRNTTDSRLFPTRGSMTTATFTQAGALGGDYDFSKLSARYVKFWTLDENFLGYKTVLTLKTEAGYIFSNAPTFERFYAGGHRSMRGFDFRGVGPRGIRNDNGKIGDDPVGGNWIFLLGLEYNFPLYKDVLRGVVFVDTGTVSEDIAFDEYRVSIGTGIRLKIPFLGQAPFAFDVAIPLIKESGDETRLFSFDVAVPF